MPSQSLCPSRHAQHLQGALPQLSHLAPPQRPTDVYEVCRDDDGRTRPPSRRVSQHHPRRRSPNRFSSKILTPHAHHTRKRFLPPYSYKSPYVPSQHHEICGEPPWSDPRNSTLQGQPRLSGLADQKLLAFILRSAAVPSLPSQLVQDPRL
jgi:hypothetical protein